MNLGLAPLGLDFSIFGTQCEMNDVNMDEQVQEVPSDDYDSSVVGHPNIIYVQPIIHDSEHHI